MCWSWNHEKVNFNNEKVETMQGMFQDCIKLENIDLKIFKTNNVENLSYMFSGCKALIYLNICLSFLYKLCGKYKVYFP